jgi:hypothetical protein
MRTGIWISLVVLNRTNVETHCLGIDTAWDMAVGIGKKVVEVTVVRTSVVVGLPLMVVSTGVRVVMTMTEVLKRVFWSADLRTTAAELAK